jgi:CheY-like chemotaxis protein/HPt (histidine-containing phosphotransfer) domain-containing protein
MKAVRRDEKVVELSVAVEDTGIGIPKDKLDYIFESFTQQDVDTSRQYGGTGLGLSIVKQLVELQGGRVTLQSKEGEGSVFTFIIPFEQGTEAQLPAAVVDNGNNTAGEEGVLKGIRVLVAEDNMINQKVVSLTLNRQGAITTVVGNGQLAIDALLEEDFDVILMDLQMPEVDGYTATRRIREVLRHRIPIIAMTADALKGEAEKCFSAGMNGYISKPFEPKDLYAEILKWTTIRQQLPHMTTDERPILDLSYLYELSGSDPAYIREVLKIFMGTMPEGLGQLADLVHAGDNNEATYRQAHFLKSSVSIVRIRDMYDNLSQIESMAKEGAPKEQLLPILEDIQKIFALALPLLNAEIEKGAA